MKHDKMKKQRTNVAVPLTAAGRKATRRAEHREREVAGGCGVTQRFSFLSKLAFMLNALLL